MYMHSQCTKAAPACSLVRKWSRASVRAHRAHSLFCAVCIYIRVSVTPVGAAFVHRLQPIHSSRCSAVQKEITHSSVMCHCCVHLL
jgi:hypothetical protein